MAIFKLLHKNIHQDALKNIPGALRTHFKAKNDKQAPAHEEALTSHTALKRLYNATGPLEF